VDVEFDAVSLRHGRFDDPQQLTWVLGLSAALGMLMSYGRGLGFGFEGLKFRV
jgi:hypothetical protein